MGKSLVIFWAVADISRIYSCQEKEALGPASILNSQAIQVVGCTIGR